MIRRTDPAREPDERQRTGRSPDRSDDRRDRGGRRPERVAVHERSRDGGPSGSGRRDDPVTRVQRQHGNRAVQRTVADGAFPPGPDVAPPGDEYEREAERVADAVIREPQGADRTRPSVVRGRIDRPVIQRQEAGDREQADENAGQQPQRNQARGHQEANQAGGNQVGADQAGGDDGGLNLTEGQIDQVTATVLAESATGQEDQIKWVYYNLVREQGFDQGLGRSAAHARESGSYKFWMTMLGDDSYADDDPPRWARGEFESMQDCVDTLRGRYEDRATTLRAEVVEMIGNPEDAEYEGYTGQGNEDDFNLDTAYWSRARQYYRLQNPDIDTDVQTDGPLPVLVEVVRGDAPNRPQVIFDAGRIQQYFRDHPDHLPGNVPDVDL